MPDDGNILVVFAPHVGLTTDGKVGKVHRPGQDHTTSACGAAVGAYSYLKQEDTTKLKTVVDKTGADYQQQYIIHSLAPMMDEIMASDDPNQV